MKVEEGKFAKKVYTICMNRKEFIIAMEKFINQEHKNNIFEYGLFEVPKKGVIIYIVPTLMHWGHIKVFCNTQSKRNKLILGGYIYEQ